MNYHGFWFGTVDHTIKIFNDFARIVIGDFCHPARTNSISAVDEYHRYYRQIVNWLDFQIIVVFVF